MARQFDPTSSQYLRKATDAVFNPANITICATARETSSVDATLRDIVHKAFTSHSAPFYQYTVGRSGAAFQCYMTISGVVKGVTVAGVFTLNAWVRVVASYDGNTMRCETTSGNGTPVSVVGSLSGYATPVDIGRFTNLSDTSRFWRGDIGEVAIYSRALSADERAVYLEGGSSLINPVGLIAHWPLGGLNGQHDRDIVGGYDLSAYNSPTWADHPPMLYPGRRRVVAAPTQARMPWHLFAGAAG